MGSPDVMDQLLEAIELDFIHLLHHLSQFALWESLLFEPYKIIFGNIDQVNIFVFAKRHLVMCQFDELFWVWVQMIKFLIDFFLSSFLGSMPCEIYRK